MIDSNTFDGFVSHLWKSKGVVVPKQNPVNLHEIWDKCPSQCYLHLIM